MPNWCKNSLWISHDDNEKMCNLIDSLKSGNFLNFLKPINKSILDVEESNDWCIDNWGCKWDIKKDHIHCDDLDTFTYEEIVEMNNKFEVCLTFYSACSPPIPALQVAENNGFNVALMYIDIGSRYMGMYNDGEDFCLDF